MGYNPLRRGMIVAAVIVLAACGKKEEPPPPAPAPAPQAAELSMWVRASGANAAKSLVDLWNSGHADKIALT